MGVDLTLLPLDCDRPDFAFSHTVLSFDSQRKLWDEISALPSEPAPSFTSFYGRVPDGSMEGEHGYGEAKVDSYDVPLRCVTALSLAACLARHKGFCYPKNEAILAYIAALPKETRVVLYWH
jgi:hypothetical protein